MTVEAPASSEEIECAVKVEVEVAVEVTAYELVDLLLAGGVQILKNIQVQPLVAQKQLTPNLELVQIALNVETIWSNQVRLSLHKVGCLQLEILCFYKSFESVLPPRRWLFLTRW